MEGQRGTGGGAGKVPFVRSGFGYLSIFLAEATFQKFQLVHLPVDSF